MTTDLTTLRVPYSDERELLGDILRFGAEAQVVAPNSLKKRMQDEVKRVQSLYQDHAIACRPGSRGEPLILQDLTL